MLSQTQSYVLSTLITPPTTGDLALLANVKDEMDITDSSQDARIRRLIAEESAGVAGHCHRVFGLATWVDQFRPQKGIWGEGVKAANNPLMASKWPLIAQPVPFLGTTVLNNQTITGVPSTVGLAIGQPVFGPGVNPGAKIQAVYPTQVLMNEPCNAAGAGVQLSANIGILETIAGTATWLVGGLDYEVRVASLLPGDEGSAEIYRLNFMRQPRTWPPALIQVWYQAGYTLPNNSKDAKADCPYNLPLDLERAMIRILVARISSRKRDPMLVQRGQPGALGSERWWVGSTPGQDGPYPDDIMDIINRYRTPVVA